MMIHRVIVKYIVSLLALLSVSGIAISQDLIRVMPLGNSITRGSMCVNGTVNDCVLNSNSTAIGYRDRLYDNLTGAGYNVNFIGENSDGYAIMTDADHSGFPGLRDYQLAEIMETGYTADLGWITSGPYMNFHPAQLVLLHIGTNDVYKGDFNASDVTRILDEIDDFEVISGLPVLVFVSRLISERNYACGAHPGTVSYNNSLASLVQNRISNGDNLVLIDMECDAELNYYTEMADQVHPSQVGYDKMGDFWFDAIDNYNAVPVITTIPVQSAYRGFAFSTLSLDDFVTDAEDADSDLNWTFSPSNPDHFNISIDENRNVTIVPKDGNWSGTENIVFTVTDLGKVLPQLKKSNTISVAFTVNWMPEIIGQHNVSTLENSAIGLEVTDIIMVEPEKAPEELQLLVADGPNYSVNGTTVTPENNFYGDLSVPIRLSGGGRVSDIFNLTVEVIHVNKAPEFISTTLDDAQSNVLYEYQVEAQDADADDTLTFTALDKPEWLEIDLQSGLLSGFPLRDDTGTTAVQLSVSDGKVTTEKAFTIEVKFFNFPPEFSTVPEDTVEVDQAYLYGVLASDFENDPLNYFATSVPEWADFVETSQVLFGTPESKDQGSFLVILGVSDGIDTTYQIYTVEVIVPVTIVVSENNYSNNIILYPNPVVSQLFISIDESLLKDHLVFSIMDMAGKTLLETGVSEPLTEILLPGRFNGGTYLYQIRSVNRSLTVKSGKIIIQ